MIKIFKVVIVSLVLFTVVPGCVMYHARYDIGLSQVERPADAQKKYGEYKTTQVQDEGGKTYIFEDDMVQIIWLVSGVGAYFTLANKTDHSIKIIWDEASYVDTTGSNHRVMHSGVKYIDRDSSQPPTIVIRKGTVTDNIVPTDHISFSSGEYGGWEKAPLLPSADFALDTLKTQANKYVNKTIQILLPLEIEGVVNEYIFSFKIGGVEVK